MKIDLSPARIEDRSVLRNLRQLYLYDFSEFGGDVNAHGRYDDPWLDHCWTEPNRHPCLVRIDGHPAGFALVLTTIGQSGR